MGKKALCLIFAFLFSIESFAAVVSDNDGSAFVSKSEFETLKKDFAEQITKYNDSIDGKIDGAIASYLAGIKLEKDYELDCYLDANGFYGNKYYIYWSGGTSTRSISNSNHYALSNIKLNSVGFDDSDDTQWGGRWIYNNFHNGSLNQTMDPWPVALLTEVEIRSGVKEKQIYYEKVKNYFNGNVFFMFPMTEGNSFRQTSSATGFSMQNLLDLNLSDLVQTALTNKLATYFRGWNNSSIGEFWSVWKTSYFTIQQNESETNSITLNPFSTAMELVWDKNESSTTLAYTNEVNVPDAIYPSSTPYVPSGYKVMNRATNYAVYLKIPKTLWFPWQILSDTVQLKQRRIKNLYDIDKSNGKEQEGLTLGSIPDQPGEMKLSVKGKTSTNGTVYVYVGESPVTNWDSTDFKGKKVSSQANKEWSIEIEDVKKKHYVWIMFKNSSSSTGTLKITKFSVIT